MAVNVAISGFGRIGRLVLRSIIESKRKDINVVAINDLAPVDTNAFLLANDTVHGPLNEKISVQKQIFQEKQRRQLQCDNYENYAGAEKSLDKINEEEMRSKLGKCPRREFCTYK